VVAKLKIKSKSYILPNGIAVEKIATKKQVLKNRVGFCSRLDKRKGIEKFIELADEYRDYGIKFDVYGPDAGELDFLISQIASRELSGILEYKGALQAAEVQPVISDLDILVLPSKDEPFPMVVLEALAVGTPVLVMPSCGFSNSLRGFNPDFIAQAEDLRGLTSSFEIQRLNQFKLKSREEIRTFCRGSFGITAVVDKLLNTYRLVLANDI
jgi:glycosyltransferase involved in cell wall biosynthesis